MSYLVGIVGERSFQDYVRRCRPGQTATISHESDNPFDPLALRVDVGGRTVGYVPRDHWVREVVHDQGKAIAARIHDLPNQRGNYGIVLAIEIVTGTDVETTGYTGEAAPARRKNDRGRAVGGGILSRTLRKLFR